MEFQKNVLLKNYTTFRIGGRARYFFAAGTKEKIIWAIKRAKEKKLPFFILGGGSNLLVSDEGFKGLIIKIQNTKYQILNTKIIAEAGTPLGQLVNIAAISGLSGLEWAVAIPGTIGGAVFGNAGTPEGSMKDIVRKVEVLDVKNLSFRTYSSKECKFNYRSSIFKKKKNLVIISAELQLKKGDKNKIKEKIKKYLNRKKEKQPLNCPSAGSVFMNPKGFFAGKLIERAGLKGEKIGGAEISEKHANFIVNSGKASGQDVIKLINLIKKQVKKKFKVVLKEEIQFL